MKIIKRTPEKRKKNISRDIVASAVFQLLPLAVVPARNVGQIPRDPRYLRDIMTPAFGTDRLAAQRAELDPLDDAVRTMRMIERAHDLQIFRSATRARRRIDNVQAVRAFITALFLRNVLKALIFFNNLGIEFVITDSIWC